MQNHDQDKKESLFLSIVKKRNKMITLANSNGLLNNETIKCSQELDSLLNQFQSDIDPLLHTKKHLF
jgi:hypothetical protein